MDISANPLKTRELTAFEHSLLEWLKVHPGRTAEVIANEITAQTMPTDGDSFLSSLPISAWQDEAALTELYRAIEALISEGWARRDERTQAVYAAFE
jgi:hypothetical protein